MPHRKPPNSEEEQLKALHERAELIRRRSHELIRQMEILTGEVAERTERVQNQTGPFARKPR